MAYDESGIELTLTPEPDAGQVLASWTSPRPGPFQLFVDGRLYDTTRGTSLVLPWPEGPMDVRVGTVLPGEAGGNPALGLPPVPGRADRARLTWLGGRYLDPGPDGLYDDVVGFEVLQSPAPGEPPGDVPVATLPLFEGGFPQDGAGVGPAGRGGAGRSALRFRWVSGRLTSGIWEFQVRAVDRAGNPGAIIATVSVTIEAAPPPPLADTAGARLHAEITGAGLVRLFWDQE